MVQSQALFPVHHALDPEVDDSMVRTNVFRMSLRRGLFEARITLLFAIFVMPGRRRACAFTALWLAI